MPSQTPQALSRFILHRAKRVGLVIASSAALTLGAHTSAWAEKIVIPLGQQAPEMQSIKKPYKGLSADEVIQIFGKPLKQTPAVGSPPISRWTFDDFVVYFESDKVIHTVLKHRKNSAAASAPSETEDIPSPGPTLTPAPEKPYN